MGSLPANVILLQANLALPLGQFTIACQAWMGYLCRLTANVSPRVYLWESKSSGELEHAQHFIFARRRLDIFDTKAACNALSLALELSSRDHVLSLALTKYR